MSRSPWHLGDLLGCQQETLLANYGASVWVVRFIIRVPRSSPARACSADLWMAWDKTRGWPPRLTPSLGLKYLASALVFPLEASGSV